MMRSLLHPEKKSLQFLYLTLSGLLSGVCMAFPSVFGGVMEWLAFIPAALAVFTAIEQKCSLGRAYWGGFWLIYSQHIIVYHWFISFYPLDFTGMSRPAAAAVVVIAIFGLSFLAAMFGGIFGLMTVGIGRLRISKRYPILVPICAAECYVLNEWIRTQFWFGVPWGRLALGQLTEGLPIPVLSASVFGAYFISFLIVAVSFLLAQALYLKRVKVRVAVAFLLVLANLMCGIAVASLTEDNSGIIKVAAIQANINSRDKWDSMSSDAIFDEHVRLTVKAAGDGAKLIVWPETTVPDSSYIPDISALCREYGVNILFGIFDYDDELRPRNVLCLIDSAGKLSETVYVKRHLVPFGEYVPMRDIVMTLCPPLGEIAMLSEDLLPGDGSEIFEAEIDGMTVNIGGLICFDSIYEDLAYTSVSDGAQILCVATNDSWFEDSRAVYMHCAQSRLRAIETGLPIVRAANTGISAVITSEGKVTDSIDPLVEGYIVSDVRINDKSVNSRIANEIFLWLCISVITFLPVIQFGEILIEKRK